MAYTRFCYSDWYIWWNSPLRLNKCNTKDMQLIAIAHKDMEAWPRYFTYRQLTEDLESCIFTLKHELPPNPRGNLGIVKRCIRDFIQSVNRDFI